MKWVRLQILTKTRPSNDKEAIPSNEVNNDSSLDINILYSLPTPDSVYPLGTLLHLDFSFYDITSIYGFILVLDIICVSISYYWVFPTWLKHSPISVVLWLLRILSKQDKTIYCIRVDENGTLTRYTEFLQILHKKSIIIETTSNYKSSSNSKVENPIKTCYQLIRIALTIAN